MRPATWIVALGIYFIFTQRSCEANDFSSFLSINASLAVVVDHDYMQYKGSDILVKFQKILDDTIRDNLRVGGINLKFYTWSTVRLKKDFIAAITIMDCKKTWNFFEASQANTILLFAITDTECARLPSEKALMIPIIEKGEELSQLLSDIKMQEILPWRTFTMLLDKTLITERGDIIKAIGDDYWSNNLNSMSLYVYTIDSNLKSHQRRLVIREALTQFKRFGHNQFIVFTKSVEEVIEVAEEMNMFHIYNQWLFFLMDSEEKPNLEYYTQNLREGAHIAFAFNDTQANCQDSIMCMLKQISLGFVSALSKVIREEELIYGEISDEEWETVQLTKREKQIEMLSYMKEFLKLNSSCSSCTRWAFKTGISWGKTLEIFKNPFQSNNTELNNKYHFIDIGYWTPILGFVNSDTMFPHISQRFRNITMDIIAYHNPPWQIIEKTVKGKVLKASGIVIELISELSQQLNFTYELYDAGSTEVAVTKKDKDMPITELVGKPTYHISQSVIKMLASNKFFMAAVAHTIDEGHLKPFNYTSPISIQQYSFISKRPDEVSRIYLFTAPFTSQTWFSLMGVLIVTAPMLFLINVFVPTDELRTKGLCQINNCFWYVYGALLQQGGIYLPKADSGRLIVGVWWIGVIILVTTYCGNLVAFLTFPKFQPGMDVLSQTFSHNDVHQFGLRNSTFFEKYTAISSRSDFKEYMDRKAIYTFVSSEDIDAIEKGVRVNVDWRINLQGIIQKHFEKKKECKFILGKEDFVDEQIGLLMPKDSPFLVLVNSEIKKFHEMGFLNRWHKINLPVADKCQTSNGLFRQIINHKVNLNDMQGCFLILIVGFSIAVFVISCEYWFKAIYLGSKQRRKTNSQ